MTVAERLDALSGDAAGRRAAPATQGRQRECWIDVARGIGIILVVYGHVLQGLVQAGLFRNGPAAMWMHYALYTFHMPLFFFLAGVNVPPSLQRGRRSFLLGKAWTIAYPYVLWTVVQSGVAILLSREVNRAPHLSILLGIGWRPIAQFWFLYALMLCHMAAALLPSRLALFGAAAVGFIVFQFLPVRPDLAITLHDLPLYVAGIGMYRVAAMHRPAGSRLGTMAAIAAAFVEAVVGGGFGSGWDALGLASVPACVLGVLGTIRLSWLLQEIGPGWLARIGRMSMTIYVLHILAASGMRVALVKLHVPHDAYLYLFACTFAGIGTPMIAHIVLQRLHLLAALGLAPLRAAKARHGFPGLARADGKPARLIP